jgi:hypothetical protein
MRNLPHYRDDSGVGIRVKRKSNTGNIHFLVEELMRIDDPLPAVFFCGPAKNKIT